MSIENVDIKRGVAQQFGQVAANYATSAVHAGGVDLPELVRAANLTGGEHVLDAGCGAGHAALAMAPHVAEVVALDLSPEMLAQVDALAAARGITNIRTERGDVEALPFADAAFDLVTSRYSAHHWPQPATALAEIRRVLRPEQNGGRLLLADVVSSPDYTTDTFVQCLELLRDPFHVRDHTVEQWLALLSAAGLSGEVVFTWPLRLDFATWVARMKTPPANVAMLRSLLGCAPDEVRRALNVESDDSFTFAGALFRATVKA